MDGSRFYKVFSNVPDKIRKEVVVVVDDKPYSWNAVYLEIKNETELGRVMLKKLLEMEII